jgi:hypothetical protein
MKTVEEMNDEEKKLACCKLLARLFYKLAKATNATEINYKVDEITMKDTGENIGSIKVKWVLKDSKDVENE